MTSASPEFAPNPLAINEDAARDFDEALGLIKQPPFDGASASFANGLNKLGLSADFLSSFEAGNTEPERIPASAITLQTSDGLRDIGFTRFRQHLLERDGGGEAGRTAESAARLLRVAEHIPKLILDRHENGEIALTADEQAQVIARHGVVRALALRARSSELARGSNNPVFGPALFPWMKDKTDNELFLEVDAELARGNNGYWRMSNAGVAARDLRANEHASLFDPRLKEWRKKMSEAWKWTRENDRGNLLAGTKTVARHLAALVTGAAAVRASRSPNRV